MVSLASRQDVGARKNVDRIDQFDIFKLGSACKAVKSLPEAPTFFSALTSLVDLKRALSNLAQGRPVPVRHSRGDLEKLLDKIELAMSKFKDKDGKLDISKDWNQTIDEWFMSSLTEALKRFEITFAAEMRETSTYYVSRTGIFDTALLVDRAIEHFPISVREGIPDLARKDFLEAGKSLAFGLYTAAAFHLMRSVEATLTAYHAMFLGEDAKERKTWQSYLDDLEKIKKGETPDPKTIRTLQQLKDLDRNPIMHPRETRNAIEAQSLFEIAFTAIVAMVQEMQEKGERLAQEKLPLDEPKQAKVIDGPGKAA